MVKNNYEEEYYERCKAKGIDYAYYGNWQKQYAKMVIFVSEIYKSEYANKTLLDVGTACGANLRGFRETGIFTKLIGIDISNYLITKGREVNNFNDEELIIDDSSIMKNIEDESIDFLHCSQLFEHLERGKVLATIDQFYRVMKNGATGFITLNAIKSGQTEKDVIGQDPTHITVLTEKEWKDLFDKFIIKKDTETKLKRAMFYPGSDSKNFYEHYYDDWSVFIFTK